MLSASHFIERETPQNKTLAQQPRGLAVEEPRKCNSTSNKKDHSISSLCVYYIASIITLAADLSSLSCVRATPYPTPLPSPKTKLLFFFSWERERHTHDYRARLHHWSYHNKLHVNSFEKCLFLRVLDQIPNPHFLHILHYLLQQVRSTSDLFRICFFFFFEIENFLLKIL